MSPESHATRRRRSSRGWGAVPPIRRLSPPLSIRSRQARRRKRMEIGAEFVVLISFLVFVGGLIYLGVHRTILKALDARGEAIASELAQAAKLREEATALLASFERKTAEAEANAAAIIAEARAQAEQLAADASDRLSDYIARRTKQAEAKI